MNLMKKLSISLIASTMCFTASASFMTIEGTGGFTTATDGSGNPITIVDTATTSTISWGEPVNVDQSSLELTDMAAQSIDLLNTGYLLSTLTHFNNEVNGGLSVYLANAIISGQLNMTGMFFGSPADIQITVPTQFNIDFLETTNGQFNLGYCDNLVNDGDNDEDGIDGGDGHSHVSYCDDRFDYTIDGASFPIGIPLIISGIDYMLSVYATTDAEGLVLVPDNRFWTPEGQDTTIYTWANLAKVPEPASIAILGLGLLGLASSRKRKS
ncbi:THxN family PEP-CTERM protein [Colwellia sp. BRX8-4]|uniref:THxN family PEP-CTERM protein n=1 Tax=Colwellia sp. BRX8-4 TaxID=2759836 RepID=UPI0015F45943|nr:THxN family PEP-CTERM protein [Colwellia sp. BRX8-4]MBA6364070.1 THxN family PEP-CTERM protein [Colwellia sp. BRX8-8]MBA6372150.1 THxN family PEP-CTERM protein [Colwellia sp. BRX8-4]